MHKQIYQNFIFHVHGMHCRSCESVIESELNGLSYVSKAKSNLRDQTVKVEGEFGGKSLEQIAGELTKVLVSRGYTISPEREIKEKKWSEFKIAVPIALGFALLFVLLQKLGVVNLVNVGSASYGTAFAVGIIASLSTCMAVVGGLVLSMSATFASTSPQWTSGLRGASKLKPLIFFHTGRIISFFVLGGIIGAIGSAFVLGTLGTFILGIVIGLVMLMLGVNLLDVFHWAKRLQPSMPKFLSKHALGFSKFNHSFTPALVGLATFFLPCGFTQSMQIYTLSTGSFLVGGLTMLAFALGTLPVLALVSFSSFSIKNSSKSGVFFKSAGLIVIIFALFNLINSIAVIGWIPPVFNF